MIEILAIEGESFDLKTGEERPHGISISNGISVRHVAAPNNIIKAVVELFAEAKSKEDAGNLRTPKPGISPVDSTDKVNPVTLFESDIESNTGLSAFDEKNTGVGSI